jgi:hypothetical protein
MQPEDGLTLAPVDRGLAGFRGEGIGPQDRAILTRFTPDPEIRPLPPSRQRPDVETYPFAGREEQSQAFNIFDWTYGPAEE